MYINEIAVEKVRREAFSKDMARYYEEVKVCDVCYKYYLLLDWARNVLDTAHQNQTKGSIQRKRLSALDEKSSPSKLNATISTLPDESTLDHNISVPSKQKRDDSHLPLKLQSKNTWKSFTNTTERSESFNREHFADLDDYLRKGSAAMAMRRSNASRSKMDRALGNEVNESLDVTSVYRGSVMLACCEGNDASLMKKVLEDNYFDVFWVPEGRQVINHVLNNDDKCDCILVQKDLPLADAFAIVAAVRENEKMKRKRAAGVAAAQGRGVQPPTKRTAVICLTGETSPSDLRVYMESGMDGCISYPISKTTLLNTIRAAVPHHLALQSTKRIEQPKKDTCTFRLNALGTLEGSTDSATAAGKMLAISGAAQELDPTVAGVVQIDADTRLPYAVVDYSRNAKVQISDDRPFFNLVVCHDMFDTLERMKIFFKPIAQKYIGLQVLLWNYAGQAFTEWREEQLLNNEYHAVCLNELLGQVGSHGTKDFDTNRPFYMLGFGNGSSILSFYSSHYAIPNLRGLVNVNGWSFIDSYLAGVMHDCINVFQSAPPTRPDLPVYFYSRFLFSKDYLSKVSVPLALNLYTAVHNPITLKGRLNLCKGVLQTVDVRSVLRDIDCPIICIQSTQDSLVRPLHSEPFVNEREGEVRSIFKVLESPKKTCVIWLKSGHEAFQECKKSIQILFEQILTGFHESHDISFPPAPNVDPTFADHSSLVTRKHANNNVSAKLLTVEDKFIDNVLQGLESSTSGTNMNTTQTHLAHATTSAENVNSVWGEFSESVAMSHMSRVTDDKKRRNVMEQQKKVSHFTFDPSSSSFEKQDSSVYNTKRNHGVTNYPEVKEYMSWRLKRNKKRLQRLQGAARIIQAAFRAHIARQLVKGIRRRKAAIVIQRNFRGWLGRCAFLDQARRIWATLLLQRSWRGYVGRRFYFMLRLRIAASANIQRLWRGYVARVFVAELKARRHAAACKIQSIFRRNQARRNAWIKRQRKNAAIALQRVYRGHLGKRKASAERDRYIFSKSQSQGIEFGRQMLLEHKLHATRLQSEVTLLTQEKVASEEQVEALLEEITSFEEGVRILEKEMHQLSRVEADASAYMDEESKYELREQKIRLDKEFGDMLAKIGNRKDMLNDLERKLSSIDKARQSKEEELRTLERKLVVLLEEQQNELRAIKKKQDVRGALLAASHETLMNVSTPSSGGSHDLVLRDSKASSIVSTGGFTGPSLQEKQQAAQLMQSTETLMKFGFMSMSMTYFSSLNMVKALRTVSAQDTVMAALADVHSQRGSDNEMNAASSKEQFLPSLKKGQLPGQESLKVSSWSVDDVSRWLQTISLGQYAEAFIDAAVDGEFLYDLNDDDLKNTLGVEHRLHRKKILNCVHRLKIAEAQRNTRVASILREMGTDHPQVF